MSLRLRHAWLICVIAFAFVFLTEVCFAAECRVTTIVRLLDDHGNPVLTLAPEQLSAEIGGSPAKVVSAAAGMKPVTVLLLEDSSSMKEVWGPSIAAAKQIAASAGNLVAVVVFGEQALQYASGQEATQKLLDRLATAKIRTGRTALYDSVIAAAAAANNPNTALVVIGDGGDNASLNSSDQTAKLFLKNHWPAVFGLILDYSHDHTHRDYFKKVVAGTGGLVAYPSSPSNVAESASQLSAQINAPFRVTLQSSQPITKPESLRLEATGLNGEPRHELRIAHITGITSCAAAPGSKSQ